jgi:hypothetical protein
MGLDRGRTHLPVHRDGVHLVHALDQPLVAQVAQYQQFGQSAQGHQGHQLLLVHEDSE